MRWQLRAILHNAGQTGLQAQNHEGRADFRAYLAGLIGHVSAANARRTPGCAKRCMRFAGDLRLR
ncbi:MAG TPA: hypothetical protein VLA19_18370 [Herpetosiphonaceae bacterium]|nr:hypothetical protein [Herpetosiphonaceae bacterium]